MGVDLNENFYIATILLLKRCSNYFRAKNRIDFRLEEVLFFLFQVFDHTGTRLDVFTGLQFRPRPLVSPGPQLVLRLYGGGGAAIGFRATYSLLDASEALAEVQRDCGGLVEDLGGAITMMDMNQGHYDCVWIVKALSVYYKTHLYLKVADFAKMGRLLYYSRL